MKCLNQECSWNHFGKKNNCGYYMSEGIACSGRVNPESPQDFVDKIINEHTNLVTFIRLFNTWVDLTYDERQQVFDLYQQQHPNR
jgi:hypothetical protein